MPAETAKWRRCSSCKMPIAFGAAYWVCNVSTCNRPRTGLFFCTVSCWDAHLSVVNHRESWALERRAPGREEWERGQAKPPTAPSAPRQGDRPQHPASGAEGAARSEAKPSEVTRRAAAQQPPPRRILPAPAPGKPDPTPRDVLIVVSKLKAYVRAQSGFNTSERVVEPLSDAVRELCERAIEKARAEGRKTLLERDFE